MTVAQQVARNSFVQLGGRGVTIAVSLAAVSLLSRYLGPERFGDYQFVLAFLLLANLSDLGLSTIAIRTVHAWRHHTIVRERSRLRLWLAAASGLIAAERRLLWSTA